MRASRDGFKGESFQAELVLLRAKGDNISRTLSGMALEQGNMPTVRRVKRISSQADALGE
jgi:hypothetical protein